MRQVLQVIEKWGERIEAHRLHTWLSEPNDEITDEQKLWFSLYFTNFIMYFRELNLHHISYGAERSRDPLRAALSQHADEDMTHSRFFMKDFRTLGMDEVLGWQPSQVIHWLASSRVNEPLRDRTSELTSLVVGAGEPAILYPVVEAIETCGHSLFTHTSVLAERIAQRSGKPLIYWGHHHLERETGHAVETGTDELFHDLVLSPAQREDATRRVIRVFEIIEAQNSDMMRLAQETISQGGFATRSRLHTAPVMPAPAVEGDELWDFHFWPDVPHANQQPAIDALARHVSAVREMTSSSLFTDTGIEDTLTKLRLFTLFLAFDVTGAPAAYQRLIAYRAPHDARMRAINRLTSRFGRRSTMIYTDWSALELDELLDWNASRTLEFLYLDEETEVCRELRNTIVGYIDRDLSPLNRYWTMLAFKAGTDAYAGSLREMALRVEQAYNIKLPYLAQRRNPELPDLEPDPEADAIRFELLPVDSQEGAELAGIVDDISEGIRANLRNLERTFMARERPELHRPLANTKTPVLSAVGRSLTDAYV